MNSNRVFQFIREKYARLSFQLYGNRPTRLLAASRRSERKSLRISLSLWLLMCSICLGSLASVARGANWTEGAKRSMDRARDDLAPYWALDEGRWQEALGIWRMREAEGLLSAAERFNLGQLERRLGESARAPDHYFKASLQGNLPATYEWARHRLSARDAALGSAPAELPGLAAPRLLLELAARAGFAPAGAALDAIEQGREPRPWNGWLTPGGEPYVPAPTHAPRSVYNRAACAEASRRPARSAFLFTDAYSAGKVAHTLAKARGQSGDALAAAARRGMWQFHSAAARLSMILAQALVDGELPLLPGRGPEQIELARREARAALSSWKRAGGPSWKSERYRAGSQVACRFIQRLSTGEDAQLGPLPERKLQRAWLEALAASDGSGESSSLPCSVAFELSHESDPAVEARSQAFELSLLRGRVSVSFPLWNSFFRYFEEAWRLQPDWLEVSEDLKRAFQTLAVEEMILWVSSGCESLTRPDCDSATLTSETLRSLLAPTQLPDPLRAYPRGQGDALLESWNGLNSLGANPQGGWNSDSASQWLKGLQEQWAKARGDLLRRERKATEVLIQGESRNSELSAIWALRRPWNEVSSPLQAYALCSEWSLALHSEWGWLHDEFSRMRNQQGVWREKDPEAAALLDAAWKRFKRLSSTVLRSCERWEREGAWEGLDPLLVSEFSFSEWFNDLTDRKVKGNPHGPRWDQDPWQALRAELSAWIELRSTGIYREALITRETLLSTDLFNPLTAPTACGLYDPSFHRRALWTRFLVTAGGLALSAGSGVPALILAEPLRGRVQHLGSVIDQGRLRFQPEGSPERLAVNLWLGTGVSRNSWCSLSLGGVPAASIPVGASISGLSVSACRQEKSEQIDSDSPENWVARPDGSHSCFTCTLNFLSVSKGLQPAPQPALLGNAAVALVQLVQALSDPHEMPRKGHPKPESIRATRARHGGEIPEECVTDLVLGRECEQDRCARFWETRLARDFQLRAVTVKVERESVGSTPQENDSGFAVLQLLADPGRAWKVRWEGSCLRPTSEFWEEAM